MLKSQFSKTNLLNISLLEVLPLLLSIFSTKEIGSAILTVIFLSFSITLLYIY